MEIEEKEFYIKLGLRLQALRTHRGFSRAELAERWKAPNTKLESAIFRLRKIELGAVHVSLYSYFKLARALGYPFRVLFDKHW